MPNAEPVTTGSTTSRSRRPSGTRSRGGRSAAAPAPPAAAGAAPLPAADTSPDQPQPSGDSESPAGTPASGQPAAAGSGAAEETGRPRERWLAAARARHTPGSGKEPMTPEQLTYLLDLLHEDGKDPRLVSETYGYLDRGMSKAHASVQIKKLRGEFVETRTAA
jgi:hypothetical protein